MADETITSSESVIFSGACPTKIVAPSALREVRTAESFLSEPDTVKPLANMMRAIPLIPAPPIPIK